MEKVKLLVDSSCDLPQDLIAKYNISILPFTIVCGEKEYKDKIEINQETILKLIEDVNAYPKTVAITVSEFISIFTLKLEKYEHIYLMTISSKASSTYNNALLAVSQLKAEDRITVLDSQSLSGGFGVLALACCDDIENGLAPNEILDRHNDRAKRTRMTFIVDSMKYLYRGGRCSGLTYLVGNAFKIHPIANMADGKLSVFALTRGKNIMKGLDKLFSIVKEDIDNDNIDFTTPILLPHVLADDATGKMKKELCDLVGDKMVIPVDAATTIYVHTGTDTLGVSYIKKHN